MNTAIRGIPTRYAGTQFRSRLEARWAAFFDLIGWKWEYEPFDLNGYIPDFLLLGANVLVEVKPTETFDPMAAIKAKMAAPLIAGKNYHGEPTLYREHEILLVGLTLGEVDGFHGWRINSPRLGWLLTIAGDDWDDAVLAYGPNGAFPLDFHARWGSYHYRISGEYDGDHHLRPISIGEALPLWREAGNVVQWRRAA